MKRINNIYENCYNINNILLSFDEVIYKTKNKKEVNKALSLKPIYIYNAYNVLKNRIYAPGDYIHKIIYEPKKRDIYYQNIFDKLINNIVCRNILIPCLEPSLINTSVASRKNMGTHKGLKLYFEYRRIMNKKYKKYYILKLDIKGYYKHISKEVLYKKVCNKIKDKEALKIIYNIIFSFKESGISIGNMSSQIFALYYLNEIDHMIKEEFKIKYYIRYQDDFILMHNNLENLKKVLNVLKKELLNINLEINNKTKIYSNKDNMIFLGVNKFGKRKIKFNKIKNIKKSYMNENLNLNHYIFLKKYYKEKLFY